MTAPAALAAEFMRAAQTAPVHAKRALDKTLADIVTDAQATVAVDTGYLRASISWESRQLVDGASGEAGPTANYGIYIEEGTSRMPGRPYMEPAARRRIPGLEQALAQLGASL
jgi:HK97 gp10 family phage protein